TEFHLHHPLHRSIFLLVTMVTVCACWTPSKKPEQPTGTALHRFYQRSRRSRMNLA
ncbi:unnamed protein product, partial [Tetraodon nigroviridis]